MKFLRVLMILVCIILIISLSAMLYFGIRGDYDDYFGGFEFMNFNFFGFSSTNWKDEFEGTVVPDGKIAVDASNVTGLSVQWIGGKVELAYHDSNVIRLEQTCKKEIPEDRLMVYRVDADGTLRIREGAERKVTSSPETSLTLYLPEGMAFSGSVNISGVSSDVTVPSLNVGVAVNVTTVSGDVLMQNVNSGGSVEVSTTSGDITATVITASGNLTVSSTSGDITVADSHGTDAEVSTTSGDIAVHNSHFSSHADISSTSGDVEIVGASATARLEVSTTSGDLSGEGVSTAEIIASTVNAELEMSGSFGKIDVSSVNGEVEVAAITAPTEVSLDSTNGELLLILPSNIPGFTAEYETVNGDFSCSFPTVTARKGSAVYGDGSVKVNMSTVNGELTISSR